MNGTALIINGVVDHVHMLIRVRAAHSAAEIVRVVKANSSRWVREKHSARFRWQTGYGVFSVSESSVAAMTKYIAERLDKNFPVLGMGGKNRRSLHSLLDWRMPIQLLGRDDRVGPGAQREIAISD